MERIRYATRYGIVKGVIWHQGEANSQQAKAQQYLVQLTDLIKRFRILAKDANLPFVAGELGLFFKTAGNINQQLALLSALDLHTAVVSAAGLTDKGDQLHFDAVSASELGRRYAAKMLALQH